MDPSDCLHPRQAIDDTGLVVCASCGEILDQPDPPDDGSRMTPRIRAHLANARAAIRNRSAKETR